MKRVIPFKKQMKRIPPKKKKPTGTEMSTEPVSSGQKKQIKNENNIIELKKYKGRYPNPMSYRPQKGGAFLTRVVYQSPAFCSLSKNGHLVLIALMDRREFKRLKTPKNKKGEYVLLNGDRLTLPYKMLMEKYYMNMAGATRGIDELLAKGFMRLEHHGGGGKHDQSIYSLTEDYLRWMPGTVFEKRPQIIRRGFQDPVKQRLARKK